MLTLYILLGLAGVAGACWAVWQAILRQRRLDADLTRLERLAAEVSMHAEAVLDRADERIARLEELLRAAEAFRLAPLQVQPAVPVEPPPAAAELPSEPAAVPGLRDQALTLAQQGMPVAEIAATLGIPRGEVQLILNLKKPKSTAPQGNRARKSTKTAEL